MGISTDLSPKVKVPFALIFGTFARIAMRPDHPVWLIPCRAFSFALPNSYRIAARRSS
jgi:hypothetical protein